MTRTILIIITILILIAIGYFIYLYFSSQNKYDHPNKKISLKILNTNYAKNNIIDLLEWASKEYPYYEALKYKQKTSNEWKTVNYLEYNDNVTRFSKCLLNQTKSNNIPKVAIIGFNSPEWFYAHLGTIAAGGISVGMYPTSDTKTCEHIINEAKVNVLVVEDTKQIEKFSDIDISSVELIIHYGNVTRKSIENIGNKAKVIKYLDFVRCPTDKNIKKPKIKQNDIATIIYTSGTTGKPKGAVIKHNNITDILNNMLLTIHTKANIDLCVGERFISYLPLNHIAAQVMDIYVPIASLGTVFFAQSDALKGSLSQTVKDVRPTIFIGVPRVWEKIMEKLNEKLSMGTDMASLISGIILKTMGLDKCKYAITAAAPISTETREFFDKFGLHLCDVYGMSETTGPISLTMPGITKEGSSGIPIINVKFNNEGEIYVKGKSVFSGYYNNKTATESSFTDDGWFKTGDIGRIDEDGYLFITGRSKDLIITAGGENISPVPIEDLLKTELSFYFDHIIVIGDKRKFLSVVLVPKFKSEESNDLHQNIIGYGPDLSSNKDLKNIINDSISNVNKHAPSNANKIQKWIIINNKFKIGDELTPTLKLRRLNIQTKYEKDIDKLYADTNKN